MTDIVGDRISAHYDHEAYALYIAFSGCAAVHETLIRSEGHFDLDMDGNVVGIEILSPPAMLRLAPIAAELGFADKLDTIYAVDKMARGMSVSGNARLTTTEAWLPA